MERISELIDHIYNGKLKHISRFGTVGIANTLIDFFVFTVFYKIIGVNYVFSQAIGYSCGVINSFVFNRKWTFEVKNANNKIFWEFVKFLVSNLISLVITMLAIDYLVKNLQLNVYISKIIVTLIAQVINFLLYKLWVFS
ncbi:GtrA family protein [Thermoanaerobacter pentosaceus]|uniref:Flippase GtrA n=1 Tax=Thermoanaerobacter pentosaceus TaxID=694059 RepID=A0ABT9M3F9_9THEO|nr:GtrA family protein [Thermoanaerobacter pentosaceus]MDP9750649.1 putative flippase GtrA [Thermoanaerobacter pentosaceus]